MGDGIVTCVQGPGMTPRVPRRHMRRTGGELGSGEGVGAGEGSREEDQSAGAISYDDVELSLASFSAAPLSEAVALLKAKWASEEPTLGFGAGASVRGARQSSVFRSPSILQALDGLADETI